MKRIALLPLLAAALITTAYAQILDVPPRGRENERAVQGGSYPVPIDATTPLPELVSRLAGPWELVPTRKAYWIGYTDDMFSIAAHKDAAIAPLLEFFNHTTDSHARVGVLYTLHLIGINSTIVGRFNESFVNKRGREALLWLIDDEECGDLAIELLARDPWPTDLSAFVNSLKAGKPNRITLVNALFRYVHENVPFRQDIDENWDIVLIDYETTEGRERLGELRTVAREQKTDDPKVVNAMLNQTDIVIQWGTQGRVVRKLALDESIGRISERLGDKPRQVLYDLFLLSKDKVDVFSFSDLSDRLWHYVEPGRIVIVGPELARERWLRHFDQMKAHGEARE